MYDGLFWKRGRAHQRLLLRLNYFWPRPSLKKPLILVFFSSVVDYCGLFLTHFSWNIPLNTQKHSKNWSKINMLWSSFIPSLCLRVNLKVTGNKITQLQHCKSADGLWCKGKRNANLWTPFPLTTVHFWVWKLRYV